MVSTQKPPASKKTATTLCSDEHYDPSAGPRGWRCHISPRLASEMIEHVGPHSTKIRSKEPSNWVTWHVQKGVTANEMYA